MIDVVIEDDDDQEDEMIEGIRFEIPADVLREHLKKRVAYHEEKAAMLTRQAAELKKENVELQERHGKFGTTRGATWDDLEHTARHHRAIAVKFRFCSEYVINDTYRILLSDFDSLELGAHH